MKRAILLAVILASCLVPLASAQMKWSGYFPHHQVIGKVDNITIVGVTDAMQPTYTLPSWVQTVSVNCILKQYDYNNDGKVDYTVYGLLYANPFTNKTICYVPTRGGAKKASTPAPVVTDDNSGNETSCTTETECADPVCHTVPHFVCDDEREVCVGHGIHRHCYDVPVCHWEHEEVCADPVCHDVEVCA